MNSPILGLSHNDLFVSPVTTRQMTADTSSDFSNILKASIENVNDTQLLAEKKTEALASGETEDLHDVMVTAQKAAITLETTVQVQRKVIDAYNEIMRMQV